MQGKIGKGWDICCCSASRQTGFKKSVKVKWKKNPFHGVSHMYQRGGRAKRKTEIEPDTLKMYLGHAGSMRRTKCYLQLGWLCKLSLPEQSFLCSHSNPLAVCPHIMDRHMHALKHTCTHLMVNMKINQNREL